MALPTPVLRLIGGLAVSTALLGVLPGQALAAAPAPPTPPPIRPDSAPAATPVPARPAPAANPTPSPTVFATPAQVPGPGVPQDPQVVRVPQGAPATGGVIRRAGSAEAKAPHSGLGHL
ncbi:hypothetical protein ACFSCY_03940, partial [Pseudonocardia aurantiaca]